MVDAKKDIPAWQQQSAPTPSEADLEKPSDGEQAETEEQNTAPAAVDREKLIQQARNFLAHEEIQDATTESKISFLEEKGLTNEEIQELLGISRNDSEGTDSKGDDSIAVTPSAPSSSAPPIITYPEFLLHASKPPPIVTPDRALKTIYGVSAVGATIYGVSKFILQPMFDTLSEARHDFFTTTKQHLEPLNEKLEGVVSVVPPHSRSSNVGHERRDKPDDAGDDNASIASDPTEMFHRDMGVQTSPPSSPSLSAYPTEEAEKRYEQIGLAASRLSSLKDHLDSLLGSSNAAISSSDDAKLAMKETEIFLDQIRYGEGGGYASLIGDQPWRSQVLGKAAGAGKKIDAVDELKAEIRSMKGAMLSARNFPRGMK